MAIAGAVEAADELLAQGFAAVFPIRPPRQACRRQGNGESRRKHPPHRKTDREPAQIIRTMSTWGALAGLAVAIILILRKVSPVYSMILGALVGGLIGDMGLETTVTAMSDGIKDLVPAIVRITPPAFFRVS